MTPWKQLFQSQAGTIFGFLDIFSGGNLRRFSIFALGIMPYITASIILQLATVVVPYLEKLSKEGRTGTKEDHPVHALPDGGAYPVPGIHDRRSPWNARAAGAVRRSFSIPGWGFRFMVMITLTTGTAFIMWIGEQITERGIGNGISLIIFAGIVVGLPSGHPRNCINLQQQDLVACSRLLILMVVMVVDGGGRCLRRTGQRKIPVQYAKRVVGRRVYGGQATHLPLRVNSGGVIPVIFAASIVSIPSTLGAVVPNTFMTEPVGTAGAGNAALQPAVHRGHHLSSVSFMSASFSTRWKLRTISASTADISPGSGPARGLRRSSTGF